MISNKTALKKLTTDWNINSYSSFISGLPESHIIGQRLLESGT